MGLPSSEPDPENCVFLMIDHQVCLLPFLRAIDPVQMKNNIPGQIHTKVA